MKTILKKLTVSRVILTRIIFIALFFTVTTAVPVHKAEADVFDDIGNAINDAFDGGGFGGSGDTHCMCSNDDYVSNGGTGGNGNSGGGGDYGMDTQTHASGFDSFQMASNLGNSAADFAFDQTGIRYDVNVGNDGHGGYQYTLTEPDSGGGGSGGYTGYTQSPNGNVGLVANKTTVFINEPVRMTWNMTPGLVNISCGTNGACCGTAGGFGDWPNPDLYTQNWVNDGYQLNSTSIQSTGTYLGFSSPGSREFQTENVGHYVFNYRCAFRTANRAQDGNMWDNSPLASVSIDVLPAPATVTPTATISATNCIIASGASTCYANLTWNIEDATNPNVRNTTNPNPMILSILATGVSVPRAIFYGQNTIVARDSTTVLATTFAKAICASGSVWIGTQCGPKTDLNPVSPTIVPQCAATDSPCPASTVSFTIYNAGAPISAGTNVPYRIEYRANGSASWQTAVNGNWSGGIAYPGTTPPINNTFLLDLPYGNHKVRVVVNLSPSNPSIGEVNFSNNTSNELGLSKSPDPVQLEFRADNEVIRYNQPATLKYQIVAPYDVSCTITGPVEGSRIINHTAGDDSVYPITSLKLTNQQKFTITCPDADVNGFTAPGVSKDVIMEVVPVVWEV